jgi:hypothetical protein
MAQINLLKQTSTPYDFKETGPKILSKVFLVILAALVIYYAWLFFDSKSIDGKITQAQAQIASDQQKVTSIQGRDELLTRQLQIKNLQALIAAHVYWSQLFPELARVTLKTASYTTLKVGLSDDLTLGVTVPSLSDLDKYMQIFDLSQFNQNFSDIRINGFNKVQGVSSTAVQFQVSMTYNPSLIQYNAQSGN